MTNDTAIAFSAQNILYTLKAEVLEPLAAVDSTVWTLTKRQREQVERWQRQALLALNEVDALLAESGFFSED